MSSNDDTEIEDPVSRRQLRGGKVRVPRSRGALSGIMLMVLGAWGALIPFIGPYFNFSYSPDTAWHWTAARGWLEVLPGVVAFVGGLLSLVSSNRVMILLGDWLGVLAGAWFIIGRDVASWLKIGSPGTPAGTGSTVRTFETLALFSGLGALILFFGANAVGRLSVRSIHDVRSAQRRETRTLKGERKLRDSGYEQGRRDALAEVEDERARTGQAPIATGPAGPTVQQPVQQPMHEPMRQQPLQGGYPPAGYPDGSNTTSNVDQGASSAGQPPRR